MCRYDTLRNRNDIEIGRILKSETLPDVESSFMRRKHLTQEVSLHSKKSGLLILLRQNVIYISGSAKTSNEIKATK